MGGDQEVAVADRAAVPLEVAVDHPQGGKGCDTASTAPGTPSIGLSDGRSPQARLSASCGTRATVCRGLGDPRGLPCHDRKGCPTRIRPCIPVSPWHSLRSAAPCAARRHARGLSCTFWSQEQFDSRRALGRRICEEFSFDGSRPVRRFQVARLHEGAGRTLAVQGSAEISCGSQSGTWRPSSVMTMPRQAITALMVIAR